jgi:cytochrome c-type biogenesis protein CcmH/NrfF
VADATPPNVSRMFYFWLIPVVLAIIVVLVVMYRATMKDR